MLFPRPPPRPPTWAAAPNRPLLAAMRHAWGLLPAEAHVRSGGRCSSSAPDLPAARCLRPLPPFPPPLAPATPPPWLRWDRNAGAWRAFKDACPHRLVPLSEVPRGGMGDGGWGMVEACACCPDLALARTRARAAAHTCCAAASPCTSLRASTTLPPPSGTRLPQPRARVHANTHACARTHTTHKKHTRHIHTRATQVRSQAAAVPCRRRGASTRAGSWSAATTAGPLAALASARPYRRCTQAAAGGREGGWALGVSTRGESLSLAAGGCHTGTAQRGGFGVMLQLVPAGCKDFRDVSEPCASDAESRLCAWSSAGQAGAHLPA